MTWTKLEILAASFAVVSGTSAIFGATAMNKLGVYGAVLGMAAATLLNMLATRQDKKAKEKE